jgi:hypothetical protein
LNSQVLNLKKKIVFWNAADVEGAETLLLFPRSKDPVHFVRINPEEVSAITVRIEWSR